MYISGKVVCVKKARGRLRALWFVGLGLKKKHNKGIQVNTAYALVRLELLKKLRR